MIGQFHLSLLESQPLFFKPKTQNKSQPSEMQHGSTEKERVNASPPPPRSSGLIDTKADTGNCTSVLLTLCSFLFTPDPKWTQSTQVQRQSLTDLGLVGTSCPGSLHWSRTRKRFVNWNNLNLICIPHGLDSLEFCFAGKVDKIFTRSLKCR